MIEYIKGELAELTPALAVVDCHGVGYGISVSLNTYSAIQGKKDVRPSGRMRTSYTAFPPGRSGNFSCCSSACPASVETRHG